VSANYNQFPADLPAPEDDGAADHLAGIKVPELELPSTLDREVNLAEPARGTLVAYVYPRTGVPGLPLPAGWDDIPGARGCTPQSCAYRDSLAEFSAVDATVVGISAQSPEEQREFAERAHIPFALLSDSGLRLAEQLRLPTFTADGMTLYERLTFVAKAGKIARVFYPVFPPDRSAETVLAWLTSEAE
jgi:peroxiredoxin